MFRSVIDILDALFPVRPVRRRERSRAKALLTLDALEDRWVPAIAAIAVPDTLEPLDPYAVGDNPQAVVTADFNGDGRLDLAVANFASGNVSVLLGANGGAFGAATNFAVGSNPTSLAVGDLDGDGDFDLVVANNGGTTISVLLGTGTGSFGSAQSVALQAGSGTARPDSLAVGDFNGDGKLDVAVTSQSAQTYEYYDPYYGSWYSYTQYAGQLSVLIGNGGGFSSQNVYSISDPWASSVSVADLSGDGKLDAVVTNYSYSSVSVFLGAGNGTLGTPTDYLTGWSPQAVAIADFTNDGKVDLITVGQTVDVLPGLGNGTFQPVQRQYIDPVAVATADFNGDGKLDAVTVEPSIGASILLGRGDGTFALPIDAGAGASPMGVTVGDFNRDGKPDVAVANGGSDNLSVMINDGNWPALNAPTLSINDPTITEGNAGTTNLTFVVTLSAAYSQDVTVKYATADGDYYWSRALAGEDYQSTSGTVTIKAGQTSATLTVPIIGDRTGEESEAFKVKLSGATNAFISDSIGVGTIFDDEPRISIESPGYLTEGNTGTTAAAFTVRLSAASDQEVRVNFSTAEGDTESWYYYDYYGGYYYYSPPAATADVDYQSQSGTVVFAPGETAKTITVQVKGDRIAEDSEAFSVNLSDATGGILSYAHGVGTIGDDEPYISISSPTVTEGSSGTVNANFTVTLSQAYDAPVTVDYATGDASWYGSIATAGTDYQAASGKLTFAPGETTKTIAVNVTSDRLAEYQEYFAVNLSNATNSHLSYGTAIGTIVDDDAHISVNNVSVKEGNSGTTYLTFTVSLSAASDSTVTVRYATENGSAAAGSDYKAASGTLSFAPGERTKTVRIAITGDTAKEYDEYFYLNLSNNTGNAVMDNSWGVGEILNDDGKKR